MLFYFKQLFYIELTLINRQSGKRRLIKTNIKQPTKKLRGEKMFRPEVISLCVDETYSKVILQTKFLSP